MRQRTDCGRSRATICRAYGTLRPIPWMKPPSWTSNRSRSYLRSVSALVPGPGSRGSRRSSPSCDAGWVPLEAAPAAARAPRSGLPCILPLRRDVSESDVAIRLRCALRAKGSNRPAHNDAVALDRPVEPAWLLYRRCHAERMWVRLESDHVQHVGAHQSIHEGQPAQWRRIISGPTHGTHVAPARRNSNRFTRPIIGSGVDAEIEFSKKNIDAASPGASSCHMGLAGTMGGEYPSFLA